MDSELRRVHPKILVVEFLVALGSLGRLFLFLLVVQLLGGRGNLRPSDLAITLIGVPFLLIRPYIAYYLVQFGIVDQSFVYRVTGIGKRESIIPIDRIQEVQIVEKPIHKLFGLCELHLDTGAGGTEQVTVAGLELEDAKALRAKLLRTTAPAGTPGVSGELDPHGETIWHVDWPQLVVAGLGQNYAFAMLASTAFFLQDANENGARAVSGFFERMQQLASPTTNPVGFAVAILLLLAVGWLAGIVMTVLKYYNLKLHKSGEKLVRTSGLLTSITQSSSVARIQLLYTTSNWFQRRLNFCELKAGFAAVVKEKSSADISMICPIVINSDLPRLMVLLAPRLKEFTPRWQYPHPSIYLRSLLSYLWFAVVVTGAFYALRPEWAGYVGIALTAWVTVLSFFQSRFHRFALSEDFLQVREGAWNVKNFIVPVHKVQTVAIRQSIFQRRLNLCDIEVRTAHSGLSSHIRMESVRYAEAMVMVEKLANAALEDGVWSANKVSYEFASPAP